MSIGNTYMARLYQAGDRLLIWVLGGLLLLSCALAPWYHTWPEVIAVGLPSMAVTGSLARTNPGALVTRCAIAAALMIFTALNIHQAHGMLELHFGVFVLLAFLLVYRDWVPVAVAATVIAVHHLALDFAQRRGLPVWVFSDNTGFGIVVVHAAYVVFEAALLMWNLDYIIRR